MNTTWQQKLKSLGYSLDEQGQAQLAAPGSEAGIVPLSHQRIIRIQGPDTEKFLQGQLSCDIADVDRIGSRLGAHCNIKGHMISLFRVMKRDPETFWLRTDAGLLDKALATIRKYILFSKADADPADELVGIGLFGAHAVELAGRIVAEPPTDTDAVVNEGNRLLVRVPGNRFECWLPADDAVTLIDTLLTGAGAAGADSWLLEEIRAGIPDLRPGTSESFIPQMTNLQVYAGVSFAKGCYTGQEVVTRLQHRGILKKPMYRAAVTTDSRPQPGQMLHTAEKENVGEVVVAAPADNGRYELLAVISKEQAENHPILLGERDGPQLELLELPYQLDPRLFESKR